MATRKTAAKKTMTIKKAGATKYAKKFVPKVSKKVTKARAKKAEEEAAASRKKAIRQAAAKKGAETRARNAARAKLVPLAQEAIAELDKVNTIMEDVLTKAFPKCDPDPIEIPAIYYGLTGHGSAYDEPVKELYGYMDRSLDGVTFKAWYDRELGEYIEIIENGEVVGIMMAEKGLEATRKAEAIMRTKVSQGTTLIAGNTDEIAAKVAEGNYNLGSAPPITPNCRCSYEPIIGETSYEPEESYSNYACETPTKSAQTKSEQARLYPQYYKEVPSHVPRDEVDTYVVNMMFPLNDESGILAHARKKLLIPGVRSGGKTRRKDVVEARDALNRWLDLHPEF